jgi:hypothetical protein
MKRIKQNKKILFYNSISGAMKRQTFSTRRKENIRKKSPYTNTRKGKRKIEEPCNGEGKNGYKTMCDRVSFGILIRHSAKFDTAPRDDNAGNTENESKGWIHVSKACFIPQYE